MPDIAQRLSSVPETDSALDLKVWLEKSMGDLRQDLYTLKYGDSLLDVHIDSSIPENTTYQRLKVTVGAIRQSATVTIRMSMSESGGIGISSGYGVFRVSRVDGGAIVNTLSLFNEGSGDYLLVPEVSGNDVIWGVTAHNNGTTQTYTLDFNVEIQSNDPTQFTVAEITGTTAATGLARNFYFNDGEIVNSGGNIGINTTAPGYKLDVNGTGKFNDIITKSPWADVRAYGAVGDGVTDDTAAIVAAIAAVTTDGGAVLLSGNFKTTSSITVPANVSIIGLNPVSSKITYNVAGYAFKVTGSNAVIKSIRFDIGTTATGAINVNADSNAIINVKILNNYFNGSDKTVASRIAVLFSGSIAPGVYPIYYCWAEGCYFDAWNTGIKTTNPSGNVNAMANAEYLNHNTFRNIGSYAIDLAGSSLENVLIGNWADTSPGAVGLHLTGIRNMVLGFHTEMGAGAKTFIIDSGANSNWLIVNDNSPGTSEDNGSGNFLITPSSAQFRLLNKTPASATAAGVSGTLCWDTSYVYVCVATNSWKRVAIAAW